MNHEPLIGEEGAGFLAEIINRAAERFNVAALSTSEVVAAFLLLERCTAALWREHKEVLMPLYQGMLDMKAPDDDEESNGSDGHSN